MQRRVRVVRVFSRDNNGGNPLGIHDGLLADVDMQHVAAVLGYSETIFLGPNDGAAIPVRIFTPTVELPFAGHPLVGATWHLAAPDKTVTLRCATGIVVGRRFGSSAATLDVEYQPEIEQIQTPTGVTAAWIARMPLPYEIHQLSSADSVATYEAWDQPEHRLVWAGEDDRVDVVRARFFAFQSGVDEDSATGSAAVALAAVMRHEGKASGSLTIHQGAEVGRPSRIDLTWTSSLIAIGGDVIDDGIRMVPR